MKILWLTKLCTCIYIYNYECVYLFESLSQSPSSPLSGELYKSKLKVQHNTCIGNLNILVMLTLW